MNKSNSAFRSIRSGFRFPASKLTFLVAMLSITMLLFCSSCHESEKLLEVVYLTINQPEDILPVKDSLVRPVDYLSGPSLGNLNIEERKQKFIDLLLPSVLITRFRLDQILKKVQKLATKDSSGFSNADHRFLDNLFQTYKTSDINELMMRLKPHPVSIVLAQAAIESAWGTSRFYLRANNVFGIWSFDPEEQRIKAGLPREGVPVYLKKFNYLSESVDDYFKTIACGPYDEFRKKRYATDDAVSLLPFLDSYSELNHIYVNRLKAVIEQNRLTQYDSYMIDPEYIVYR